MGTLRRLRRGEQGASAVEFALMLPLVLFLLIFPAMDFALLVKDQVAMEHLTRDAARVASTKPRVGNVPGHAGPAPTGAICGAADPYAITAAPSASNEACRMESFASLASNVVEANSGVLPKNSIVDFWVYLANQEGYPTITADWKTDTNRSLSTGSCLPAYCVRYRWFDPVGPTPGSFRYDSGTWSPQSINACPRSFNTGGMAVGIFVRVNHKGLFGSLLPTTRTLTERSVVKFEPMRPQTGSGSGVCMPATP